MWGGGSWGGGFCGLEDLIEFRSFRSLLLP